MSKINSTVALAIALAAGMAMAQPPHDQQQPLLALFDQTRACMQKAGLSVINADEANVRVFMVISCGGPLRSRMVSDGVPKQAATQYIGSLAFSVYYEDLSSRAESKGEQP